MLDLWLQPVDEPSTRWAAGHADVLDTNEARRWDRYRTKASQDLFLVAHVATRFVLSHYGQRTPGDWEFTRTENGRPEIAGAPAGVRFNISHTEGMVAMLVHSEHDAGVDVESSWRATNIESVSRRVFTESERGEMFALPQDRWAERFYQLWTLKESFIKAKGKGFAMPLSKFSFTIGDDGLIGFDCELSLDPDPTAWRYQTHWIESGHVVSVCAHVPHAHDGSTHAPVLRSLDLA